MARLNVLTGQRYNLDPQAAHCAAHDDILSQYVDHYWGIDLDLTSSDIPVRLEDLIESARVTYQIEPEYVCAVNLDLDLDWGDCLSVGRVSAVWTYDTITRLVLVAISPSAVEAREKLAGRFSDPW